MNDSNWLSQFNPAVLAHRASKSLERLTIGYLRSVLFQDTQANPSITGALQRNGSALYWYDGTTAGQIGGSRTRSVHIDINGFTSIFGAAALAQVGSAAGVLDKTFAWAFDGASSETIQYRGLIVLPADITSTSTITVRLHWAPSTAGAGNVYWRCEYAFIDADDQIDEGVAAAVNIQTATPAVADQRTTTDIATAAKAAGDILMKLNLARIGDDVLDTYNALDAWLVGVELRYTADS